MAGHRTFRQQAEAYLEEYFAFRKYGNNKVKKDHLRKWFAAATAKDTVSVEDMEYLMVCFYERKEVPKVVEALAHPNIIGLEIENLDELSKRERPAQRLTFKNRIQ